MPDIKAFSYNDTEIRTVPRDGEPWFVLNDVCSVLGLGSPHKVADRLDEDERNQIPVTDAIGRQQSTTIINESGLYSVILRSDKPEAKHFRKWVTSEVLPAIRKTGGYVNNDELFLNTYLPNADETTRTIFRTTLETVRGLIVKQPEKKQKGGEEKAVAARRRTPAG